MRAIMFDTYKYTWKYRQYSSCKKRDGTEPKANCCKMLVSENQIDEEIELKKRRKVLNTPSIGKDLSNAQTTRFITYTVCKKRSC